MKSHLKQLQILVLLLSLTIFTSCSGQVSTSNTAAVEQERGLNETPKMIKTQGVYSNMTNTGPHTDTLVNISAVVEDAKGNIWVATAGEGVYCYNGEGFTNLTTRDGLLTNDVYCIIEDRDKNLWFGTTNGVSRYNGISFNNFPFSVLRGNPGAGIQTLAPDMHTEVWSMLQDNKGNIWLGTTNGIYCYDGSSFTAMPGAGTLKPDWLSIRAVTDIIQDTEGDIWVTSWFEGLCRFDGKQITRFKNEGLVNNDGLLQDRNGDLWIGTRGNGVLRYNGKTFEKVFADMAISAMKEDEKGNIWFSGYDRKNNSGSVILYNPADAAIISSFTAIDGQRNSSVTSIATDRSGNVWFGSNRMTLTKYDGKTFTRFLSE